MKKTAMACLLLLVTFGASARLHADLRLGASAATLGDRHLKLGLRGGATAGYLFNDHFGLRTGLHYAMKGATTSNDLFDYAADRATRLSYLELPVEATVGCRLSPRSRFDLHAGPYVARLLRAEVARTASYTVRKWDAGIGIGFDFAVGHFVVGPEVQYGLLRAASPGDGHNIAYSLTAGYRF